MLLERAMKSCKLQVACRRGNCKLVDEQVGIVCVLVLALVFVCVYERAFCLRTRSESLLVGEWSSLANDATQTRLACVAALVSN